MRAIKCKKTTLMLLERIHCSPTSCYCGSKCCTYLAHATFRGVRKGPVWYCTLFAKDTPRKIVITKEYGRTVKTCSPLRLMNCLLAEYVAKACSGIRYWKYYSGNKK